MMMLRLSLFLILHNYSAILMFLNFLGRVFTSIVALLGLVFPSFIVQRGQAAVFSFSRSTSVSVRRQFIQPMELDWIWAICVSLLGQKSATSQEVLFQLFPTPLTWSFPPLTNVSPLWCSLSILKVTWLLATVGYVSARVVGKASAGIVGHVSRQLIKHLWSIGLIQIRTLRLDVLHRLEVTRFASQDHVTSQPFFGIRLGQITSFDPCLSHCLKLWILALIYRLLDPDQRGGPCNDSLTEVRESHTDNQTLHPEKIMSFEDSLQGQRVTLSRQQTRNTLCPPILETPIPGSVTCFTNDRHSAAKYYETRGHPLDRAQWSLAATFDKFPSFGTVDANFHEPSVQLHKDEQTITAVTSQEIRGSSSSTSRLEYSQSAGALTVLDVARFSVMNYLCIVHLDIKLGSPGHVKRVKLGRIPFNPDPVQGTHYPKFVTQPRINEVNFPLPFTTLESGNASATWKGEAYSYDTDNLPGTSYAFDEHCLDEVFTYPEVCI